MLDRALVKSFCVIPALRHIFSPSLVLGARGAATRQKLQAVQVQVLHTQKRAMHGKADSCGKLSKYQRCAPPSIASSVGVVATFAFPSASVDLFTPRALL